VSAATASIQAVLCGFRGGLFLAAAIEAELRSGRIAFYSDSQKGSRAVFCEERIDGLQDESLPPCLRLRDFGFEVQCAVEVDVIAGQIVTPPQIHRRAGHAEGERAKLDHLIVQLECALHSRNNLVDLAVLRLALAAPAEFIDLVLDR